MKSKLGQVTIFVIVAILIVGVVAVFYAFRGSLFGENIPASLAPVYSRYGECISEEARNGISLLSSQGGRIDIGEISPGSDFNPFSTHLNFLGLKIPYWHGFTGNNLIIENVPSVNDIEKDLELFIADRVNDCNLADFISQGYIIEKSEPSVSVDVKDNAVSIAVNAPLAVSFGEDSALKREHNVNLDSRLGALHKAALGIYENERQSLFLENYALDVLQSYAPVDGVEIQCSPKIWKTPEVVNEIQKGLAANLGAVSFGDSKNKYFNVDSAVDEEVNVMYLPDAFPSKIEIAPASQALMLAEPVGTQEGLGIMGFCYVPYHFIYDLRFPVLIQVGNGIDNFQFPLVVDIDNNVISSLDYDNLISDEQDVDVCSFAEGDVVVNTYDTSLNPVSANISYRCFDNACDLGQTVLSPSGAVLDSKIPICVNGVLTATADGYADSEIIFSSNSESAAELILEKEHPVNVDIKVGGRSMRNITAVVHFTGDDGYSASSVIPESSSIKLKEGLYTIEAFVYGNSNVVIPATQKTECFEVSRGGIAGFFGGTREQCVNVEIPATKIDYALRGGGKLTDYYILDTELAGGKITIDVSELPVPTSLEQLQYNYEAFNTLGIEVNFA